MTQRRPGRVRDNALPRRHETPLHPRRPDARLPLGRRRRLAHGLGVRRRRVVRRRREHREAIVGGVRTRIELGIRRGAEGHALGLEVALEGHRHDGAVRRGCLLLKEGTAGGERSVLLVVDGGVVTSGGGVLGRRRAARRDGRRVGQRRRCRRSIIEGTALGRQRRTSHSTSAAAPLLKKQSLTHVVVVGVFVRGPLHLLLIRLDLLHLGFDFLEDSAFLLLLLHHALQA